MIGPLIDSINLYAFFQMFKVPPKSWGQLKQVERKHYDNLREVLIPLLPRSRRILETLNACLNNCFNIVDYFYVPKGPNHLLLLHT